MDILHLCLGELHVENVCVSLFYEEYIDDKKKCRKLVMV